MAISKFWLNGLGNGGCGRGLVALQSLLTIKKGISPFNFQSNVPFLNFLRELFLYEVPWFLLKNTLCQHRSNTTSDYQSKELPPKFIRWPFLYKPYIPPPGHNLLPLSWGLGGVILKDIISEPFNYVEQNCYLKILIGCIWENGGRGSGVSCPPITFNFQNGR